MSWALRMRKIVIHPTHRKLIRILCKRSKEGNPVVLLKEEIDNLFKVLPAIDSPTLRNQSVYRLALNAMKRSFSELQQHMGFIVLHDKNLKLVESIYSKVEREHSCYTLQDTIKSFLIRRRMSRRKPKGKGCHN